MYLIFCLNWFLFCLFFQKKINKIITFNYLQKSFVFVLFLFYIYLFCCYNKYIYLICLFYFMLFVVFYFVFVILVLRQFHFQIVCLYLIFVFYFFVCFIICCFKTETLYFRKKSYHILKQKKLTSFADLYEKDVFLVNKIMPCNK